MEEKRKVRLPYVIAGFLSFGLLSTATYAEENLVVDYSTDEQEWVLDQTPESGVPYNSHVIDGELYFVGGRPGYPSGYPFSGYKFNFTQNEWQRIPQPDCFNRRSYFLSEPVGGDLFLYGGMTPDHTRISDGLVYNSETNNWKCIGGPIEAADLNHSLTADNTTIYLHSATSDYRYDTATDTWDELSSLGNRPEFEQIITSHKDGDSIILIGKKSDLLATGIYSITNNEWRTISSTTLPPHRYRMSFADWPGYTFVFGGRDGDAFSREAYILEHETGEWQQIVAPGAPPGTGSGQAIYHDGKVYLHAFSPDTIVFAYYDVLSNSWGDFSPSPAENATGYSSILQLIGSKLFLWGEREAGGRSIGFSYDTENASWSTFGESDQPEQASRVMAVNSDRGVIVIAGESTYLHRAFKGWAVVESGTTPTYDYRSSPALFNLGKHVLAWPDPSYLNDPKAILDTETLTWQELAYQNPHKEVAAVAGGERFYVLSEPYTESTVSRLNVYEPSDNSWESVSLLNAPETVDNATVFYNSNTIFLWGGEREGTYQTELFELDLDTLSWRKVDTPDSPPVMKDHAHVNAGGKLVLWGDTVNPGGFAFDIEAGNWIEIPEISGPDPYRSGHSASWTGRHLVVFGGNEKGSPDARSTTGGIFDFKTLEWIPMTKPAGLVGRNDHQAVWTGDRLMFIGGAGNSVNSFLSYRPARVFNDDFQN